MRLRLGCVRALGTVELAGYELKMDKLSWIDGSGKARIRKSPDNTSVFGAVYDLSTDQASLLDGIEGVGKGYLRGKLQISGVGSCFTYLAMSNWCDSRLRPFAWYLDLVLAGMNYWQAPVQHVQALMEQGVFDDRDAARVRVQKGLLTKIKHDSDGGSECDG